MCETESSEESKVIKVRGEDTTQTQTTQHAGRTVSIIPGIDAAAPERTETRRGIAASAAASVTFFFDLAELKELVEPEEEEPPPPELLPAKLRPMLCSMKWMPFSTSSHTGAMT